MIDKKKYFEAHIPHRVNVLLTFRIRFKNHEGERGYYVRDLFRCSKDSALIMARFFFSELGIKLNYNKKDKEFKLVDEDDSDYKDRFNWFDLKKINIQELESELNSNIIEVLKAANKAVAHINNKNVDHLFTDEIGDEIIFRVCDYLEEMIIENIYKSKEEYYRVMAIPDNNMHRERIDISKLTVKALRDR